MEIFHRRLKRRREQLSISIRKICKDLEISKSSYERWETDSYPRLPIYYKSLSKYLGISMEYLMFGTDEQKALDEVYLRLALKDQ
jgi:transcriptional regulator with XRE-family HTH domain